MTPDVSAAQLIEFDSVGPDIFRNRHDLEGLAGAIFGGQALGQGLAAAAKTIGGWPAHNMQGQFLRMGKIGQPVDYHIERVRDGRRYASRRVVAVQNDKSIFDLLCSFHDPEPGFAHQASPIPDVPGPENLADLREYVIANRDRLPDYMMQVHGKPWPIEIRLIDPETIFFAQPEHIVRRFWFRMPTAVAVESVADHQALLAVMSDYWLAGAAGAPHRHEKNKAAPFTVSSLNHSLWFHAPVRADQWLLYSTNSPWAADGRGLALGTVHDRDGRLVASAAQEASLRLL